MRMHEADPSMPMLMNAAEPVDANEAMPMPMDADANVDANLSMPILQCLSWMTRIVDAKQSMPMASACTDCHG